MNAGPVNILITSVGRRAPLVKVFCEAQAKRGGRVITVNRNRYCAGLYVSDGYYIVPSIEEAHYLDVVMEICHKENIHVILPTIDLDIGLFALERERFEAQGMVVLISDAAKVELCVDKFATHRFFLEHDIPTPETALIRDRSRPVWPYPFAVKERRGRGGTGFAVVTDIHEWRVFLRRMRAPMCQKLLEGTEFTMDVLSDLEGRVISVVPRSRQVVRAGVSDQGRTLERPELMNYGVKIAQTLGLIGPSNIQGFLCTDGGIRFTEVNPRFSGAIPLTIAAGANFPEWILRMMEGEKLSPMIGRYKRNLFMVRYEESMFLEDV